MEDLTKTQIVLLTLLVSFITSIATGIITTSLLAEAPQAVTQTIDRVVERTIEQVVPGTTVKEVTIVKEGDAIVSSIESTARSIVRVMTPPDGGGVSRFYALGVIVGKQGYVLSDKRDVQGGTYTVVFSDGSSSNAYMYKMSESGSMVVFKLQADDAKIRSLTPIKLSSVDPKLGQTVVAIEGSEKRSVAVGRVASLDVNAGSVMTDVNPSNETEGGPLLNLSGELVGLKTSNSDLTLPQSSYTVVSSLFKFISNASIQ